MLFRTSRVARASPQVSAFFLRVHCHVYIVIENPRTYKLVSISTYFTLSFGPYFEIFLYHAQLFPPFFSYQLEIPIAMATASEDTLTKVSTEGKSQIISQFHPLLEAS